MEDWKYEIDGKKYQIKIRKLTPRECWRLMDIDDADFDKAKAVNSNTQLYKQAGNGICIGVIEGIFRQIIKSLQETGRTDRASALKALKAD